MQDKICKHFNFNRKPIVYIVDGEITENNIYSHKEYFLEYKQIELLKQRKTFNLKMVRNMKQVKNSSQIKALKLRKQSYGK